MLIERNINKFLLIAAGVQVAVLALLGRILWCTCCGWSPWIGNAWSSHTSQHLFDPYSFSHVQHGILFFCLLTLCKVPTRYILLSIMAIEAGWEILENTSFIINRYRTATASLDYFGDSIGNSLGDLLSCIGGALIASKFPWKSTLCLYLMIEAGMIFSIRDSLILNIVMLLYPISAVRVWQGS